MRRLLKCISLALLLFVMPDPIQAQVFQNFSSPGVQSSNLFTTADKTYYVSNSGSDTDDCLTAPTACATLTHVKSLIPLFPANKIKIQFAAGNYTGEIFDRGIGSSINYLDIEGTFALATLATGPNGGTFTSGVQ